MRHFARLAFSISSIFPSYPLPREPIHFDEELRRRIPIRGWPMRHFALLVPLLPFLASTAPAKYPRPRRRASRRGCGKPRVLRSRHGQFAPGSRDAGPWSPVSASSRISAGASPKRGQALRLIQELHLNQFGTVGTPSPIMEYWLSSGQVPAGFTPGLRRLSLDAATLRVERMQSQWCLRDARTIVFNFGFHREEAERAGDHPQVRLHRPRHD